ncbi:MAG: hypothetical protein ACLFOY_14925 [Desulfatibacillaceae bacterium]
MPKYTQEDLREKHGPDARVSDALRAGVLSAARDNELPCAVAFELARKMDESPAEVGKAADLSGLHITKCQLGLFGYKPEKKIVKSMDDVPEDLEREIRETMEDDRLPCAAAWAVADRRGIRRMRVSAACETLGIKIKPCQLGAF